MSVFTERLHPDIEFGLKVERTIHQGRTAFQSVVVFENELAGRVLVLDGVIQTTEADEFIYHEMLLKPGGEIGGAVHHDPL